VAGHVYHVLNRGNGGATVFHKDGDYTALLDLLATTVGLEATRRQRGRTRKSPKQ
jgi:hypothetical protein